MWLRGTDEGMGGRWARRRQEKSRGISPAVVIGYEGRSEAAGEGLNKGDDDQSRDDKGRGEDSEEGADHRDTSSMTS